MHWIWNTWWTLEQQRWVRCALYSRETSLGSCAVTVTFLSWPFLSLAV